MSARNKLGVALAALLLVVQAGITAFDIESWPLSSYPMFARSPTSGERVYLEVRAFTKDGAHIQNWRPHSSARLWRGFLKKTWRGPVDARQARLDRFLRAMVAHQEAEVVAADLVEVSVEGAPRARDKGVRRKVLARWRK